MSTLILVLAIMACEAVGSTLATDNGERTAVHVAALLGYAACAAYVVWGAL